jgi:multidrug resistance efflux pump
MEKVIRSRLARLALAGVLLSAGFWAFFPYLAYHVASSAYINAELVRITAPISGEVARDLPAKGELVGGTAKTKLIEALPPDGRTLVQLQQQHATAQAEVTLAAAQLAEVNAADRKLSQQTARYRAAVLERLAHESEETTANLAACRAEEQQQAKAQGRAEVLAKAELIPRQRLDESEATHASTLAHCQAIAAQIERLGVEAAAARGGIFLQDGFNDTPYSAQQRDRLLLRRQELEVTLLNARSRLAQLAAESAAERVRIAQLSSYEVSLPGGHIVWSVLASPGSAVMEGQPIMDLADCRRRFVVVELPERDFATINTGDRAMVRLFGAQEWVTGTVRQARGSAARNDPRLLAAQIPSPDERQISIEIALSPVAPKDGVGFCDIGRLAEVRFQRAGFTLTSLWRFIAGMIGPHEARVADGASALAH